ncbi:inorganic phosphate transporter [Thalassospira lucentensis]|uniref:Phosphate transporter n=2 Tax=Thalassospira TaxID=168934 RepID=A0A285TVB7_9PROT|nr:MULTISPECIES: inorganic phosphate transporter [Thalassospira]KZB60999.1 inorganic phosphate transporter [Thalassospira lucentensis]MAZ31795.1 inorganic phosphate transporter [Thalassospira sp.]MBO9506010.1 inorganic phosphate transporter [Thalassospira sp. A3_1]MCH2276956.1 inorganic phosphate transporter [Thalassospira sp.]MCK2167445.1 inorganic phosphate transporter [Thalassospira xiamenensis]
MVAKKTALDKDLKWQRRMDAGVGETASLSAKLGLALVFLLACSAFVAFHMGGLPQSGFLIAAAVIGGYMALNIGANDVANNVGPAVGSKALTMVGALLIAAVFEAAGAIIAGGDVVGTIKNGIIDPTQMPDAQTFVWAMMAALLAAALWLNLATWLGAPVSTTHSIVGGVMGAGMAAVGIGAVNWPTMGTIAASWVISPVLGGVIAAGFLAFIKFRILYTDNRVEAARKWVPILVGVMVSAFTMYLMMKGISKVWKTETWQVVLIGIGAFFVTLFPVRKAVLRASRSMTGRRKEIASLFRIPLIVSAALLSFAHGSNDVANAIGPLAAIVSGVDSGQIVTSAPIPIWVMVIGAIGISAGLILFGPKLIKTVGSKITKLDPIRAYTVALSAALTVIVASALGLPVSSTHIAVGAVFGVGFLRETLSHRRRVDNAPMLVGEDTETDEQKQHIEALRQLDPAQAEKAEKKLRKRLLVRRRYAVTIATAWVITVPAGAFLGALLFFTIRGIML